MLALIKQLPPEIAAKAFTHPAFARRRADSYERLEFLGDSVLDLVITEAIYTRFPKLDEGELSKVRAGTVSRDACAVVAEELKLGDFMLEQAARFGKSQKATAKQLAKQRNALAALTESVIGAAFLTLGYEATAREVLAAFKERLEHALENREDAKSRLQEILSQSGARAVYEEDGHEGPPHNRCFTMIVRIDDSDSELRAKGSGRSKQEAQQSAAKALLELLEHNDGLGTDAS